MKKTDNALPVDSVLHQYRIEDVLGRGSFGITYLATDTILDMKVAIKEFFPIIFGASRNSDMDVIVQDPGKKELYDQNLEKFVSEGRRIARFRHECIVRIISFFKEKGTAYLVMEYVDGESLQAKFKKGEYKSESDLMGILLHLMKALQVLHNEDFIHRDIKPDNIFIRKDSIPLLLDFGSSRQVISEQTGNLTTMLTPGYAPFEQYFGGIRDHGPWTDIYSLAAVLYKGVTGNAPVDPVTRSNGLLHKKVDPLVPAMVAGRNNYSRLFLGSIDRGLALSAEDRPKNMEEWLQHLSPEKYERKVTTVADTENDRNYVLQAVSSLSFFSNFSEYEKKRIVSSHTRIQKCESGVYIIREGKTDGSFYILLSGSVSVLKTGNPIPLSELGPGAIFGEISFLANSPRTANVVSNEACIFVQVDKSLMDTLGGEIREKIKDRIIAQLLRRMANMSQLIHNINLASQAITGGFIKMDDGKDKIDMSENEKTRTVLELSPESQV
ncbi:MAG: hypothetical protein HW380_3022 [Magnetococcales bacterium]|nr:hypothetical protein [Magnetococcales bacterium]